MEPLVTAVLLTLKLALVTTVLLLLIGIPLAWWLSRLTSGWKPLIEAVVALPLVLPPTVLGFYLLLAFAPHSGLGQLWQQLTGNRLGLQFFCTGHRLGDLFPALCRTTVAAGL